MLLSLFSSSIRTIPRILWVSIKNSELSVWQKQYTLGNNASDIIIHRSYGQIFGPEEVKDKGGKTTPVGTMD